MRTYQKSHPWISFELDLNRFPATLWIKLGEAQSKCTHLAGVPLRPATAESLHQISLAKGVAATTAIEGNTLSEEQVLQHMKGNLKLPPSKEYLAQEVDNILSACNDIANIILDKGPVPLELSTILDFNKRVLAGLSLDEDVIPGQLRNHSVGVMRYLCPPAKDCPYLMDQFCKWVNEFPRIDDQEIVYGILKAIIAHLYIAWIHPFGDGNGRTARLVELQLLLESGVPMPAAHLLSNHYNQTRSEYYRQLDRASKSGGDIIPFIEYAVQGFIDGLRDQINIIREQQWDVAWENYVHERFHDKSGPANQRRLHLMLELSDMPEPVPVGSVTAISPLLVQEYMGKTQKTVVRDINHLSKLGLVERKGGKIRAKRETILAFLPRRLTEFCDGNDDLSNVRTLRPKRVA